MLYYSRTERGFFDDALHRTLPDDAVEISPEAHAHLVAAQTAGKVIDFDAPGGPTAIDRPPPTPEQAMRAMRRRRDLLLAESDWTMLADAPLAAGDIDAWRAYRKALRDLPATFAENPAGVTWPEPPVSAS